MKKIALLLLFLSNSYFLNAQENQKIEWLKAGPINQPRYYLKNSKVKLCGLFSNVTAVKLEQPQEKFQIESCLLAKDSLDGFITSFEVIDLIRDDLHFREFVETYDSTKPQPLKPIFKVPIKLVSTMWALRFPEGEIMLKGPMLCDIMYDWRKNDKKLEFSEELKRLPKLPFDTQSPGQIVRYHVFEYHMGCGT